MQKDTGLISSLEDPLRRKWQPTPVFLGILEILGNPTDREDWGAIGHGVTKSWTQLGS